MTITDFINNKIPPIGIGPGICKRLRYKYKPQGVFYFLFRVYNKVLYRPWASKEYVSAVNSALNAGFRLIDYSSAYGDGKLIGKAIKKSGVPRESLFITTRVSNRAQERHAVRDEFFKCLKGLGVEYVDLLQFHWPVTGLYLNTWREMEKLYEEGYVKHLGVANCHQHHLEEIFKICKYKPEIGQFEIHPLFTQKPLIQYYKDHDILVEAYTPIARYDDRLIRLPLMKRLEEKYHKNLVQIILRWHIQNGVVPLVRSMSIKHQHENIDVFDFELSDEDMKAIDSVNINSRLRFNPDNCDFSIL